MVNKISIRNLTILLGGTLTVLAVATISPALPEMSLFFKAVPNADFLVRLVLTIPGLSIAISAPFIGLLLDRWGRKPVLILSVLLYGLAGTSGYVLGTLPAILIGRMLLGLAVAGIMIGFTTLIADYFSGEQRNKFMGYQGGVMGFGAVAFLLLGGYLATIGWRVPFLLYLAAFLVLPGILFAIDEPNTQPDAEQEDELDSSITFNLKSTALVYFVGFVSMLFFTLVLVQLPFYLTAAGVSVGQIGVALAAQALMAAVVSLQYQRLKARFSFQTISSLVFLTIGIGYFIIGSSVTYFLVVLGLLISGIGLGPLLPNLNLWLVSVIPAAARGRAIGGLATVVSMGQFLSPFATQPVAERIGLAGVFVSGGGAMLLLALILFVAGRQMKSNRGTTNQASVME